VVWRVASRQRAKGILAAVWCTVVVAPLRAGAEVAASGPGRWSFSTGFDYSSGDFGQTTRTDILYVPLDLKYEKDPWALRLTLPYIEITGPRSVIGGGPGGPVVVSGGGTGQRTDAGLGDIITSVTYSIIPASLKMPLIDLTGKVKFGTADEQKGLGTGQNDYTFQVDIAKSFGKWSPFGTIGYRFVGKAEGFDLHNTWLGTLGVGYRYRPHLSVGVYYDYRESEQQLNVPGSAAPQELVPYLVWKAGKHWTVTAYGVIGFSDGSPDGGGGVQFGYRP
jgi:hypothetical protein